MGLFNKNGSLDAKDVAPIEAGALPVDEGDQKDSDKKLKKVNADVEVSFHLPHAPDGKCNVCIPIPVMDADGELTPEVKDVQIKLEGGFYTPPKKDRKNLVYWKRFCDLMQKAGWEQYSTVKNRDELKSYRDEMKNKPLTKKDQKKVQKVFGCFNPEHLTSELNFTVSFQCGDIVRKFKMVKGRLFTKDKALHQIWLKNGFQDMGYVKDSMAESKEILPELTEKEEDK